MSPIELYEIPEELGEFLGKITEIRYPRQGHTSDVGIIYTTRGRYVLKRTKGDRFKALLKEEVCVLRALEHSSIPIPYVHKMVEHKEDCWVIMEFVEGETARSALTHQTNPEVRYKIIYHFGQILSKIHSTPCPEILMKYEEWLNHTLNKAEYNLAHYSVDGEFSLLEKLRKNKPFPIQQSLIHGDYTIDNVLVHHDQITGIIDWATGAYGDPRYDISLAIRPKPCAFQNEKDKVAFFEGYGKKLITVNEYAYFAEGLYEFF